MDLNEYLRIALPEIGDGLLITFQVSAVCLLIGMVHRLSGRAGTRLWSKMAALAGYRLYRDHSRHTGAGSVISYLLRPAAVWRYALQLLPPLILRSV